MSNAPQAPQDDQLFEKCALCHLFIEANPAWAPGTAVAQFDHLHRGDDADEEIISTHDATPSGMVANLTTWKAFGPLEMRERFDDYDPADSRHVVVVVDPVETFAHAVATYADALGLLRENYAKDDDVDDDDLIEFVNSQGVIIHVQTI